MPPLTMIKTCPKVRKLFILQSDGTYRLHPALEARVERRRLRDIIGVDTKGTTQRHKEDKASTLADYQKV